MSGLTYAAHSLARHTCLRYSISHTGLVGRQLLKGAQRARCGSLHHVRLASTTSGGGSSGDAVSKIVYESRRLRATRTLALCSLGQLAVGYAYGGFILVRASEDGFPAHSVAFAVLHMGLATTIVVLGRSYLSRYISRIVSLGPKRISVQTYDLFGNPLARTYRLGEGTVTMDRSLQQFAHSPPNETPAELSRLDGLYRLRNCGVVRYIIDVRGDVHDRKLFSTVLSRPWVVA